MSVLKARCDFDIGLKKLVIRSCRVYKFEYVSKLRELVREVRSDDIQAVGSDYDGTDDDTDMDEFEDESDDEPKDKFEDHHCLGCRC